MNRYLWGSADEEGEIQGLSVLPLFLALRAVVRAKVAVAAAGAAGQEAAAAHEDEARAYFAAAAEFMAPEVPSIVAVGGLSGTGKSTLAARLAPALGRPPGAVHLRSDIERKRLFGVAETEPLPQEAYGGSVTETVYATLRHLAEVGVHAGHTVIVDAVHLRPEEREAIAATAAAIGVPFTGLWLDAPAETLVERVTARIGDASDADAEVVRRQARHDPGPMRWHRLDAGTGIDALATEALAICAPAPEEDIELA
jgi:predicted kinase